MNTHDYVIVNVDTDSISYCKHDHSPFTGEEYEADIKELNSCYPPMITFEDDGSYDASTHIATLVKPFSSDDEFQVLENVNSPKVVVNKNWNALYFSRSIIPFTRNHDKTDWLKHHTYYKHIGLYAYRADVLKEITSLPQSSLELAESLEQLR